MRLEHWLELVLGFAIGYTVTLIYGWSGFLLVACFIIVAVGLIYAYRAATDPQKESLLLWGRFYCVAALDKDMENGVPQKQNIRFEVGFRR